MGMYLQSNSSVFDWRYMPIHRAEPNSVFAASALSISGKTIFKKIDK